MIESRHIEGWAVTIKYVFCVAIEPGSGVPAGCRSQAGLSSPNEAANQAERNRKNFRTLSSFISCFISHGIAAKEQHDN